MYATLKELLQMDGVESVGIAYRWHDGAARSILRVMASGVVDRTALHGSRLVSAESLEDAMDVDDLLDFYVAEALGDIIDHLREREVGG